MKWVGKNEVGKMLNWSPHEFAWKYFISEGFAITKDGILINSGNFDGLGSAEAREKLTRIAEDK